MYLKLYAQDVRTGDVILTPRTDPFVRVPPTATVTHAVGVTELSPDPRWRARFERNVAKLYSTYLSWYHENKDGNGQMMLLVANAISHTVNLRKFAQHSDQNLSP